jgi:hypothetical protein
VAANDFHIEAKDAGFDVIQRFSQSGCYANPDELSQLPKNFFVRLMSAD